MYNVHGKIGGDSPLSPKGMKYAEQLDRFINAHYPEGRELSVWTSTMLRTGLTVKRIMERGRSVVKWKQLDEIDAGKCDGMTYEEVAEKMPDEYLHRKKHKLHYRYPRGESYQDVIHRLEPVITELMRQTKPVLIVAHQAILRVLYGYLTNKRPEECPVISIPLHHVIQLTPKPHSSNMQQQPGPTERNKGGLGSETSPQGRSAAAQKSRTRGKARGKVNAPVISAATIASFKEKKVSEATRIRSS